MRADGVDGVEADDEAIVLRVRTPGRTVAPLATLFPTDGEWDCDCGTSEDACEHVAAAIISLRQARKAGQAMPTSAKAAGTVGYRLVVDGQRLGLDRVLVSAEGQERAMDRSIATQLAEGPSAGSVEPTEIDLRIDRLLTMKRVRSFSGDELVPLLTLLAEVTDLRLDGQSVTASGKPLAPRAVVLERGEGKGYRLRIEPSPRFDHLVIPGVAACRSDGEGLVVRPLGETELTGLALERLPTERSFAPAAVAELVTEVLPELEQRMEVDLRSSRLPRQLSQQPVRAVVQATQRGPALSLLAALVYGDPPCARVAGEQLVHLGGPIPKRDRRAERRAAARLLDDLSLVVGKRVDVTGAEAVAMAARLRGYHGAIEGTAHRDGYPAEPLSPQLAPSAQRFDLSFSAATPSGETLLADPAQVLEAWRAGSDVVPLLAGGWGRLPASWLDRYGHQVADLLLARDADGALAAHAQPALAQLCDDLEMPRPPDLQRLAPLVDGFEAMPRAELPEGLQATLRDYQRSGVDWLCFLREARLGAVLADDMGLGKTLQALCALQGRTLVVCPTSVVHNWVDEIGRFLPKVRHSVYHGARRVLDEEAEVTLTTYALLRNDVEVLAAQRWDAIVLDEAQAIKNPGSQVARAAYRLRASFRLTLTGTPVENRLDELWSQMHFVNPGLLGGRESFRDKYDRPIEAGEPGAADRLRHRIRPFLLRRLKADVATELPPRTDAVLHCELDPEERQVYEAIRLATQKQVVAQLDAGGNVLQVLEALLRLRQAACDAALVPGQASSFGVLPDGSPRASAKLRRLVASLDELVSAGHKALVFSQWTSLLDRVEPQLDGAGIAYSRLDGSTRDRAAVVREFQSPEGPPVLLISLKAGGTGLNLTAADHVFLLDPWWNPAVEDQAADRAHRIGQDRPVWVYRLVAKDTVEERILELGERKRALADAALGEAHRAAALTRDDLLSLLTG